MIRTALLAIAFLLAVPAFARAQDVAPVRSALEVGDPAPDFKTKNDEGKEVTLADFKGKRVVLWFYPKADTPGCTKEGCAFRDLHEEFDKKGVVILGISHDRPEANAAFRKKFSFPYSLLSDEDGKISEAFHAVMPKNPSFSRRNTYVIDKDGKIEKVLVDVNAAAHPKQLLDALK